MSIERQSKSGEAIPVQRTLVSRIHLASPDVLQKERDKARDCRGFPNKCISTCIKRGGFVFVPPHSCIDENRGRDSEGPESSDQSKPVSAPRTPPAFRTNVEFNDNGIKGASFDRMQRSLHIGSCFNRKPGYLKGPF